MSVIFPGSGRGQGEGCRQRRGAEAFWLTPLMGGFSLDGTVGYRLNFGIAAGFAGMPGQEGWNPGGAKHIMLE